MSIGPVEYIIIGFPGNDFHGEIVPELAKLVDSGTIRIIDLVFISKDVDGSFIVLEADEDDGVSVFASLDGEVGGIIGNEDIAHAAAAIEPGNSAALLLWEDLWALPFGDALRNAGGVVLEGARIPAELIDAAEAQLDGRLTRRRLTPTTRQRERGDTIMLRRRPIMRMPPPRPQSSPAPPRQCPARCAASRTSRPTQAAEAQAYEQQQYAPPPPQQP